ncbi:MAG: class I SAM-dependent methyltransferase [Anaerolineae bacterium]
MSQAIGVAPFDAAAATYDATFTETRLGRWLRDAVHAHLAALFPPGSRVLELGCGTGEDAVWLAQQEVNVVATDASTRMVEIARQKAAHAGVGDTISLGVLRIEDLGRAISEGEAGPKSPSRPVIASEAKQSPALAADGLDHYGAALARREAASSSYCPPRSDSAHCVPGHLDLLQPASFDGALSNFGALNCVADLVPVAHALARLVRPGGRVALVLMGRWCPWEIVWHAAHGDLTTAARRLRPGGTSAQVGGETFRVHYPVPDQIAAAFAPFFTPLELRGIGVLLPPTSLSAIVERHPAAFERLARWETRIAPTWLAGRLNDHYLLELRRTE